MEYSRWTEVIVAVAFAALALLFYAIGFMVGYENGNCEAKGEVRARVGFEYRCVRLGESK